MHRPHLLEAGLLHTAHKVGPTCVAPDDASAAGVSAAGVGAGAGVVGGAAIGVAVAVAVVVVVVGPRPSCIALQCGLCAV